jgi:hypothetical protein
MGITTCHSEKWEKQAWHKRWRRRERIALACKTPETLEGYLPSVEKEIVNVWMMGKDGRQRWPIHRQIISAKKSADYRGRSPQERSAPRKRIPRKWMGK